MGNAFQIAEQRGAAWSHREIVQDPPLAADVGFDEWLDLSEAFFHKSSAAADGFAEMLRAEGVTDAPEDLAEAFLEGATNWKEPQTRFSRNSQTSSCGPSPDCEPQRRLPSDQHPGVFLTLAALGG